MYGLNIVCGRQHQCLTRGVSFRRGPAAAVRGVAGRDAAAPADAAAPPGGADRSSPQNQEVSVGQTENSQEGWPSAHRGGRRPAPQHHGAAGDRAETAGAGTQTHLRPEGGSTATA